MKLFNISTSDSDIFYTLFEELAENNVNAAILLEKYCKNLSDASLVKKVKDLEHANDKIAHKLYDTIDKVFIPPLDREDITALTKTLDDVADLIEDAAEIIQIYRLKKVTPITIKLAESITHATKLVAKTLPNLRKKRHFNQIHEAIIEINRIENEADDLLTTGLKEIFKNPKDPIAVIQWNTIYNLLEETTDSIEDSSDILRSLVTKYG